MARTADASCPLVQVSYTTRDGNDRDAHDRATIRAALGRKPSATQLVYEHVLSTSEELLWVADAVAWCWGHGGDWRRRIAAIVTAEIPLNLRKSP